MLNSTCKCGKEQDFFRKTSAREILGKFMKKKTSPQTIGRQIQQLRTQLGMSIESLSDRSKIDVKTLQELESGSTKIGLEQLNNIADGLIANLKIELVPNKPIPQILAEQARLKATEIVRYVQGTMSLEAQQPPKEYIDSLIESETKNLLNSDKHLIW